MTSPTNREELSAEWKAHCEKYQADFRDQCQPEFDRGHFLADWILERQRLRDKSRDQARDGQWDTEYLIKRLSDARQHITNLLSYTIDPKMLKDGSYIANDRDEYHIEKQAAIDFLKSLSTLDKKDGA